MGEQVIASQLALAKMLPSQWVFVPGAARWDSSIPASVMHCAHGEWWCPGPSDASHGCGALQLGPAREDTGTTTPVMLPAPVMLSMAAGVQDGFDRENTNILTLVIPSCMAAGCLGCSVLAVAVFWDAAASLTNMFAVVGALWAALYQVQVLAAGSPLPNSSTRSWAA